MIDDTGENVWIPDEENGPHLRITDEIRASAGLRVVWAVDGVIEICGVSHCQAPLNTGFDAA